MAFTKKTWKDRLVEYAGRRTLKRVSGDPSGTMVVDVTRNEGSVSQAGDAFSAANMNDLETRIANEFNNLNTDLGKIPEFAHGNTNGGVTVNKNSHTDWTCTFKKTFSAVPDVFVQINSNSDNMEYKDITVVVFNITTTGCTIRIFNGGATNRSPAFHWFAVA